MRADDERRRREPEQAEDGRWSDGLQEDAGAVLPSDLGTCRRSDLAFRRGSSMLDDLGYVQFQKTIQRLIGVDLASYRQLARP